MLKTFPLLRGMSKPPRGARTAALGAAARRAPATHMIGGTMADDRSNTLGTLNDLLFQELERLNGADLEDEDAIAETLEAL